MSHGGKISGLERKILFVIRTPVDPVFHGNELSYKEVELSYVLKTLSSEEDPFLVSIEMLENQKIDGTTVNYFHLPVLCSADRQMTLLDIMPKDYYDRRVELVKKIK